jgi:hypothetical protein
MLLDRRITKHVRTIPEDIVERESERKTAFIHLEICWMPVLVWRTYLGIRYYLDWKLSSTSMFQFS